MVADGFSQHRSVNSFTDTFSTKSGDDYDHFSRITDNSSSAKSPESSQAENKRFEKDLKSRHRTACKEMDNGKYRLAIQSFEGILADLLTRYDMNHERIGTALHNIAVANLRANELSDAKDAIEEAFRIRKAALGAMHPKVGDSLVEFGIILMALKENDRALKVFLEALEVREEGMTNAKECQERHKAQLYMAKVLHNLGCVYTELDQLDAAQETYNKALEHQKAAFGEWNGNNLNSKSDSTKPGFLTMASTICNLAYIELERGNHDRAIAFLNDSLEIQKVLLEADNKLILTTMQNIAYVYCLQSKYANAKNVYMDVAKLQQESYVAHAKRGWNASIKSLIYCQLRDFDFESAFDNLRKLEDVLSTQAQIESAPTSRDLQTTHELMGEVNFQLARLPSITEYTQRLLVGQGCGLCADACQPGEFRDVIDAESWFPKRPTKGSKMTGHRMSYA
ncbi:unnamed protein product [Cylindrotheca closterium]|uniref:Kinesin light chain n=1 Tax=Cylindrotheca closterium TaxID=2856 RepID=A0AAD2G2I0_9STRA|nr:unnamed protein product [Cylindrotheca closterium]